MSTHAARTPSAPLTRPGVRSEGLQRKPRRHGRDQYGCALGSHGHGLLVAQPPRGLIEPAGAAGLWLASSPVQGSYLVDPASSHMLVSKIKPCMSKYKQIHTVKLRMAH